VYTLSALGFCPFFEGQLSRSEHPAFIPARIAAEHRGAYAVWSASGAGRAQLAGKLRTQLEDKGLPAVGDWVILRDVPGPDRTTFIDHVPQGILVLHVNRTDNKAYWDPVQSAAAAIMLLQLKAYALGMNQLSRFDVYAPFGADLGENVQFENALSFVLDIFRGFSPSFAEYASRVVEKRHIDPFPRRKKSLAIE